MYVTEYCLTKYGSSRRYQHLPVSRLDLREPIHVSILVWSGCDLGGQSKFSFLCFFISMFWPGMVLNQGQLSIVVSDWKPYLGRPFSHLSLWVVDFVYGT